jgi:hypothetical protein
MCHCSVVSGSEGISAVLTDGNDVDVSGEVVYVAIPQYGYTVMTVCILCK